MAVKNWSITSTDLTRVVKNNDLGVERVATLGGVVLGVTSDVSTADFLDGNVLDVEANVVTRVTLRELLVVHFDGLDFSGDVGRSESNDHTGLDDTGLNTTDWNCSDTGDLVHILEGKTEGLVGRTAGGVDGINGLKEGLASGLARGGLLVPSLVPTSVRVGGGSNHVVTLETRDGNERNGLGVVSDLLDEVGDFLDNFVVTGLGPVGGVHLVDGDDELLHTESEGKESVLTGLAILGDTSLELTSTGGNDENGAISLGGTSNHVLDEITMAGGICKYLLATVVLCVNSSLSQLTNDGDHVLGGLELPEGDIDGDTTLTLGLEFVQNPGIFEGFLAQLFGFLKG